MEPSIHFSMKGCSLCFNNARGSGITLFALLPTGQMLTHWRSQLTVSLCVFLIWQLTLTPIPSGNARLYEVSGQLPNEAALLQLKLQDDT